MNIVKSGEHKVYIESHVFLYIELFLSGLHLVEPFYWAFVHPIIVSPKACRT